MLNYDHIVSAGIGVDDLVDGLREVPSDLVQFVQFGH
jgi:hypothetical protein